MNFIRTQFTTILSCDGIEG